MRTFGWSNVGVVLLPSLAILLIGLAVPTEEVSFRPAENSPCCLNKRGPVRYVDHRGAMTAYRSGGEWTESSIRIGGWIQPRYELSLREGDENLSSFYLRRVRIDARGHVLTQRLTYRIMPELARTASMRDAWANYAFSPVAQVRFGQFQLPFQWHRFVPGRTLHFAERGLPSETFGFPTGRDIGVMLHGADPGLRWSYGLGIFDGAGQNVQFSNSAGNVASARASVAVTGVLPTEEVDYRQSAVPQLAVGIGIQAAHRNEARTWDLGRSPAGNARASYLVGTLDTSLRWGGISLAADAYVRSVAPDDSAVEDYHGWGYMISGGYMVMPRLVELVGRYSDLRLDADDPATGLSQWGAGVNVYLRAHDLKLRGQYLHDSGHIGGDVGRVIFELHVQF